MPLGCHLSAYGGHDLLGKTGKLIITFSPEHEGVEAVSDCKICQFVDPLVHRTA